MNISKLIAEGPAKAYSDILLTNLSTMEYELECLIPNDTVFSEGLRRTMSGGKRLRPLLACLCSCLGQKNAAIVPLMVMLELMHTTSLIHDDFVDHGKIRRGQRTISDQEGGLAAIAAGDFLLGKAMEYLKVYRGTGINEALSETAQEMARGELCQRDSLFKIREMSVEDYYDRIKRKTALLMARSCECGAIAGNCSKAICDALYTYGLHLGYLFQIRDDMMDCETKSRLLKEPFQDVESGVITLPLLFARSYGENYLSALEKQIKTTEELKLIKKALQKTNAIARCREVLVKEAECAINALHLLSEGDIKIILINLVNEIMEVT